MNYVGRDMKDAFRADMKESVQEIKKYINEVRETEAISKRNGELYLIGFYFVVNVFMNWDSLKKSEDLLFLSDYDLSLNVYKHLYLYLCDQTDGYIFKCILVFWLTSQTEKCINQRFLRASIF